MKSPFPSLRPARHLALLALLAGFFGCTSTGVPRPLVLSDNLPSGVEPNASRFRQQQMHFYGRPTHTRGRRAICENGRVRTLGCVVEVEIQVEAVALPDDVVPPTNGYAIARLTNIDPRDTEEEYQMVSSRHADYFVWIDEMPGSRRTRWTLLYVPKGPGNVQTAYAKPLSRCHTMKEAGPPPVADVDFTEFKSHPPGVKCGATIYSAAPPSVTVASVFSMRPVTALIARISSLISGGARIPNGIWFECNGCCT